MFVTISNMQMTLSISFLRRNSIIGTFVTFISMRNANKKYSIVSFCPTRRASTTFTKLWICLKSAWSHNLAISRGTLAGVIVILRQLKNFVNIMGAPTFCHPHLKTTR